VLGIKVFRYVSLAIGAEVFRAVKTAKQMLAQFIRAKLLLHRLARQFFRNRGTHKVGRLDVFGFQLFAQLRFQLLRQSDGQCHRATRDLQYEL
jgi:hypothetical protein